MHDNVKGLNSEADVLSATDSRCGTCTIAFDNPNGHAGLDCFIV